MKKLVISDLNYHISKLSKEESLFIEELKKELFFQYKDLEDKINEKIKQCNAVINAKFINCIIVGFLHSINNYQDLEDKQLFKKLNKMFNIFLNYIFDNTNEIALSHFVAFEPKVLAMLSTGNYINRVLSSEFDKEFKTLSPFLQYLGWDFINLSRTIRSSLILFGIGDDVHGIALYRGAIELICNLILSEKYKDDYIKYKIYNAFLQLNKSNNEPIPQEMIDDLKENYKNENYIKYGWVKPKGKPITNLTNFVKQAFGNSIDIEQFLHLSAEFVHEDYAGVPYDYILLRKSYIDKYYELFKEAVNMIYNETKLNGLKKYLYLFDKVDKLV